MSQVELAPWYDEQAIHWLSSFNSWARMAQLIQTTLKQDPRKYPHQIRAAASLVIMLGRDNVWPDRIDVMSLEDILGLARRQLVQVKNHFSVTAKMNTKLKQHPKFRQLLDSMDQEIRILESRMSEEPVNIPNEPPSSWTNFWCDT